MDMIYFEQPLFVLFPLLLLALQIFTFLLNKKRKPSALLNTILADIGVLGHAVAITLILLFGGTLSDVLVLVLLSGGLSLALSPNPNGKEEDK